MAQMVKVLPTFTFWDGIKIKAKFTDGLISKQRGILGGEYGTSNRKNFTGKYYGHKKAIYHPTFVFDFIPEQIQQELGITNAETYNLDINYSGQVGKALAFLERHIDENIYNLNLSSSVQFYGRGTLRADSRSSADWIRKNFGEYSYVGEILGYGECTWTDGTYYKGYFLSGSKKKYGYGEILYGKDDIRESYKGMFWFDVKNGYGIMKYKDGKVEKGVFLNNKFLKAENFDFERMQKNF